jgi:hypothetical protein
MEKHKHRVAWRERCVWDGWLLRPLMPNWDARNYIERQGCKCGMERLVEVRVDPETGEMIRTPGSWEPMMVNGKMTYWVNYP